jgi:hypothetical protein
MARRKMSIEEKKANVSLNINELLINRIDLELEKIMIKDPDLLKDF